MRILIIGGTHFVGRHMTEAALNRGHDVSVFHRGKTGADLFPECEHILGDRDQDLDLLAGRTWDATIDACAYVPRQVEQLLDSLGDRAGRFVFVSTVSVYQEPFPFNGDESSPRVTLDDPTTEVVDGETYGGLKVLCEDVITDRLGDEALVIRPTYVVGPYDYTHRFTYWVERIADGGEVLAPGPRSYGVQVIDGRDQATWAIDMIERGATGAFHTVSPEPPFTFEQMLQTIVDAVAPAGTSLTWVNAEFLAEQGVTSEDLPLWDGVGANDPGMNCSPSAAVSAGLRVRPLTETVRETLEHERRTPTPGDQVGLTRESESKLLRAWASRQ